MRDQTSKIVQASSRHEKAQRLWKNPKVRSEVLTPVRGVLERMTSGLGRCMYCGDNLGTDIDHYWPKSIWPVRTFDWLNLLLACSRCNSGHKNSQFPMAHGCVPLLLDPTKDEPADHLGLSLSTGDYFGLTVRGDRTIEVLNLNYRTLSQGRKNATRAIARLLRDWRISFETKNVSLEWDVLKELNEHPFAGVADAMFRQASQFTLDCHFENDPETLVFLREPEVLATAVRAITR